MRRPGLIRALLADIVGGVALFIFIAGAATLLPLIFGVLTHAKP